VRKNKDGSAAEPLPCEINMLKKEAEELRKRLSSISWMMRLASQRIARRANKEDDVDGRFFAEPFECRRMESTDDLGSDWVSKRKAGSRISWRHFVDTKSLETYSAPTRWADLAHILSSFPAATARPMPSTLAPMEGEIHSFLFPFFCCFALS